ncbi:MAG: hypothetical protein AB8G86_26815 [Saprospiraceae bacterium]
MKNFIRQRIRPFFSKKAVKKQEIIEKENIVQLIESLHPFQTQFDLIRLGPDGMAWRFAKESNKIYIFKKLCPKKLI